MSQMSPTNLMNPIQNKSLLVKCLEPGRQNCICHGVNLANFDIDIIPVEAALLLNLPTEVLVPYGGVGVGYYIFESDIGSLDDEVGFFALAGLEVGPAKKDYGFFGEVRWVVLEADTDAALEAAENLDDVDVDALGVNAGIFARW